MGKTTAPWPDQSSADRALGARLTERYNELRVFAGLSLTSSHPGCKLAAREAHSALLDLKKVVEEAARTTHCIELEAVHLAVSSRRTDELFLKLGAVLERLASADFEISLAKARQNLQMAMS